MNILEVKNLSKSYGEKKVLDDISFNVESGKIVGLLGKNGCGKSTLLKLVNDLLTRDGGEILVCGKQIGVETKSLVSFLPERTYFASNLYVKDALTLFENFYKDFDRAKAEKLLVDLKLNREDKLSKMSKGMKEKVQLVLVVSRKARLYILDEPLGGVDPSTRDYILKTIISNLDEGSSALITTHLISDVEKILDDIVIIDEGKILLEGNADEIRNKNNASIDEIFRRIVR